MPANPESAKEPLPAFRSWEECLAHAHAKGDPFFIDAFMFECWLGTVITEGHEQYAEHKSGDRRLQTGVARAAWQEIFGHARLKEWPHLMKALGRFAGCDSPEGDIIGRALSLATQEDRLGEPVFFQTRQRQAESKLTLTQETISLMRYPFDRIADWVEAVLHWRLHQMAAVAPISNQPTAERRELASVGVMQANYAGLSEHSRQWWHLRHAELAERFQGRPEWRLVGQAQAFKKWGGLRQPAVDELTIHWWPLLTRYRWTDRDLRGLLRQVVPQPDAYPLREDKEFADYRKKALGLINGKAGRDKRAPDAKPPGWRVALSMIDRLSE